MNVANSNRAAKSALRFLYAQTALITLFALSLPASPVVAESNPIKDNSPAQQILTKNWLNTGGKTPTIAGLRGKVGIVHFWTLGCINCKRNLPAYNRWVNKFAGKDVEIIGIHTPETPGERSVAHVKQAIRHWGIKYPVAVDADGANWRRWHQQFWPTVYLIDKHGKIRYRWEGELEYENAGGEAKMASLVEKLLKEE